MMQADIFTTIREDQLGQWRQSIKESPAPLPYDTNFMGQKGEVVDEWYRCPECGSVELGRFALAINHGIDLDTGRGQAGPVCWQVTR